MGRIEDFLELLNMDLENQSFGCDYVEMEDRVDPEDYKHIFEVSGACATKAIKKKPVFKTNIIETSISYLTKKVTKSLKKNKTKCLKY